MKRGYDPLRSFAKLRQQGFGVRTVFIDDYPYKPAIAGWRVGRQLAQGAIPSFSVHGRAPGLTDLRPLQGAVVHLTCDDMGRAVAWVDQLLKDGVVEIYQFTQGELHIWNGRANGRGTVSQ